MANVKTSILQLIGKTPLLEVVNYEKFYNLKAKIIVKLEYFNPAGSVKDRIAFAMVEDAEKRGILKPGATLIETDKRKYRHRYCSSSSRQAISGYTGNA